MRVAGISLDNRSFGQMTPSFVQVFSRSPRNPCKKTMLDGFVWVEWRGNNNQTYSACAFSPLYTSSRPYWAIMRIPAAWFHFEFSWMSTEGIQGQSSMNYWRKMFGACKTSVLGIKNRLVRPDARHQVKNCSGDTYCRWLTTRLHLRNHGVSL